MFPWVRRWITLPLLLDGNNVDLQLKSFWKRRDHRSDSFRSEQNKDKDKHLLWSAPLLKAMVLLKKIRDGRGWRTDNMMVEQRRIDDEWFLIIIEYF